MPLELVRIDKTAHGVTATVDLRELTALDEPPRIPNWDRFFQGSAGGENTRLLLLNTVLQPHFDGGWIDAVMLRHAVRVNSLSEIALTKLDVLDALETLEICEAYEIDGVRHEKMPYHQTDFHNAKPIYRTMPGWKTDLTECTHRDHLPEAAVDYLAALEEAIGVPITMVGVGPGRSQVVHFSPVP